MGRRKKIVEESVSSVAAVDVAVSSGKACPTLEDRVSELEGDLVRIVDLLVKGDLDSSRFREILNKRQGKV